MPFGGPANIPGTPILRVTQNLPSLYTISGITKNSAGAALPACTVRIFQTDSDVEWAVVTSDALGNYVAKVPGVANMRFYAVAYLAGSPDVAGTTINTLTSSPA